MRIYAAERRVSLSVGELCSFRLGPGADYSGAARWRMALGSAWHESLRDEAQQAQGANVRAEVSLGVVLLHKGWRFELSGRIDQIVFPNAASGGTTIASGSTDTAADATGGELKIAGVLGVQQSKLHIAKNKISATRSAADSAETTPDTAGGSSPAAVAHSAPLVREIKTTALPLPADEALLRTRYPHYFRQLALYVYGWSVRTTAAQGSTIAEQKSTDAEQNSTSAVQDGAASEENSAAQGEASAAAPEGGDALCGELCFVNIQDGTRQHLHMPFSEAVHLAREAMGRLVPFLEERARTRLPEGEPLPPLHAFEQYRDGQPEALEDLRGHLLSAPVTVFEAPTGFGKTGIALELALEQLRLGVFSRIIYLSGKTTGQHQVMRQLRQMNAQSQWRAFQLRSRREHTEQPPRQRSGRKGEPNSGRQGELSWQDFGIFPERLLDEQKADVDSLRLLGARTGLCPYELAKACLPYADIWVGDYNYVFSSRHRRVFFDQPGFDPAQTLLIVDEAHNLPSRVADNLSLSLSAPAAEAVALDLRLADAPFLLVQAWEAWAAYLQGIKPANELPPQTLAEAAACLNLLCERMEAVDLDAFAPFTREQMTEVFAQAQCLAANDQPRLCWSPRHGVLNVTCLDASTAIGSTLAQFGSSVLMSATPGPREVFTEALGLSPQDIRFVPGQTQWRDAAYDVAIDATVDTRLRHRAQYYQKTADTIGRFALGARGPLTVFFPSYQYAEVVLKYLEALHPSLIVKVQPRAIAPGGQLTFVEESLLLAHVLFFVLGSSFSESIDHLGGRVDRAMIVGPALPEVNPVQEARLAGLEGLGREEAFRRVYQIPALQKINQALGRLVRAPGQSARVLLHDQRFAQNSYRSLLAPEYRQAQVLTSETALREWIAS